MNEIQRSETVPSGRNRVNNSEFGIPPSRRTGLRSVKIPHKGGICQVRKIVRGCVAQYVVTDTTEVISFLLYVHGKNINTR